MGEDITLWRCSGLQYQADWQRLHQFEVGVQQIVQGWLMTFDCWVAMVVVVVVARMVVAVVVVVAVGRGGDGLG